MRIIAFDSKKIHRKEPNFKAMLGVGVTIPEYKNFSNEYNQILDQIFKENGISRNRLVYKSSDLLSIFHGIGVDIVPMIVERLIPHIGFIDIYYSYFVNSNDPTKPFKVGIYWAEELERVSAAEFIDLIEGPYPAICCHANLKSLNTKINATYLIDSCPGLRPCVAVESVIKNNMTKFLFKGDQINYAISCADVLCKYIDQECLKNGFYLNKDIVEKLGFDPEKCQTTYIGPSWLREIKPSKNINLDVNHKYPHPIFFFFPDSMGPFTINSKDVLEKSRLFSLALDKALELGGSVKSFEPSDQNYITKEDFLVVHNDLSEKKIEELKKLACEATKVDLNYFKKIKEII